MKAWFRFNGLSAIVLFVFFVLLIGQCLTGWQSHNEERNRAGAQKLSLTQYLSSGHFGEATSENWESEFLQMAAYVLLTVFLRQKGSAESKAFTGDEPVDRDPRLDRNKPDAPLPVRRGGLLLRVYEYSLTLAFFILFLMAFAWHAVGGLTLENDERALDGLPPISFSEFCRLRSSGFNLFKIGKASFWLLAPSCFCRSGFVSAVLRNPNLCRRRIVRLANSD